MPLAQKILLGVIALLIVLVPATSYVISYRFRAQTKAKADTTFDRKFTPLPLPKASSNTNSLEELQNNLGANDPSPTPLPSPEISFGPTLSFKLSLEGRPQNNQSAKVFLGLSQGASTQNPQYLLSFSVTTPQSGEYSNLSLAGLTVGDTYTAYVKATPFIATSSAFILKSAVTDLGVLKLIAGDLNDDNVINSSDYSIAKAAYGATPGSEKWNELADFNLDGIINYFDLGIIQKHLGVTGESGPYYSTVSSGSAELKSPITDIPPTSLTSPIKIPSQGGFWLWVPE
ncbi:hypothetical protein HYS97_03090 [Candidatus Daviesbacteria bacterium]|nr:hypothetical protein [Candidatus Daviesbacteria bacterium]